MPSLSTQEESATPSTDGAQLVLWGLNTTESEAILTTGHLARLTPEERQAVLAKAAESRHRNAAARAASPLRKDFNAENHWLNMARDFGVTLAPWGEAPTPKKIEHWLNRYGLTQREYLGWFGEGTMASFGENNPTWPLRALCGILLEAIESGQIASSKLQPRQGLPCAVEGL